MLGNPDAIYVYIMCCISIVPFLILIYSIMKISSNCSRWEERNKAYDMQMNHNIDEEDEEIIII